MDKRTTSGRGEPIPSILKNSKERRKGDLLDKSTKIKREKVEGSKKSGNVSAPLPQGCTPLMYACQQADYKTVVEILNKDPATVRVRDRGLRCALHYCASSGAGASQAARAACADRVLMAAPALADARDADGLTPLHLAVVHGNVPLVQTLLAAGADLNARDDEHHTVVHWATVCGEVGALRAVLAAGADAATPDQHGGYPLHYAAQMCGAPAATDHQSRGAALEVLRALVKEGDARVDVRDADGRTPLLWAASAGSAAAVLALHQAGAKVDDADRDGLTALHCAAARGHTEVLETLVGLCGARVDVADSHGCTPLHYAAALGHADATVALLQHGADPHRQDRKGRSPAHTAAAKGQIETLRILGARGANLWLRNAKGDLPLHEAVASGRRELVKWLLDGRPSQVNATNHEGRSPLHIAASSDNADLCKLLLDRGAEVNPVARSSKNEPITPLDCATIKGHRSTAKYLQMHGALPATKLTNTDIIIDGAPITALPSRKVTSTKIDVRDRIRIEKKEIVEISSPLLEKRRIKTRDYSNSSDSSYSDDERYSRKRSNQCAVKYYDRRKKLIEHQKSFSDGYDTEKDFKAINKHKKNSKKSRSKSEPSKQNDRSSRRRHRHYTDSYSSSDTHSYSERKKSKRHRRHHRRKSKSLSESSSSESSDRRSSKRKNKKTSIHIENDEEKQKVNIVKYMQSPEGEKNLSKDENPQELYDVKIKSESDQLAKNKTLSETETDNLSVQTNMVVTEAQIHMERQSSQNGSSEITVTLDSLNNVSIETANLNVTHKSKIEETAKNTIEVEESQGEIRTETNKADSKENVTINSEQPISKANSDNLNDNLTLNKSDIDNEEQNSKLIENENEYVETSKEDDSSIHVQNNIIDSQNKDEITGSLSDSEPKIEKIRKKSFQVLSGPEDSLFDKNVEPEKELQTPQKISPSVSFANKDEFFESKDSDHLMGEEVHYNSPQDNKNVDSSQSDSKQLSSEKIKTEYISGTSSSVEVTDNVKKGLITVLDSNVSTDRAIEQVLKENASEEVLTQSSPRRSKSTSHGSEVYSRKSSIYETESYKVLEDITTSVTDATTGILKKSKKFEEGSLQDDNFSIDKLKDSFNGRVPSVSDNEIYSHSEVDGRRKRFRKKGRVKSRTTIRSRSENSERGYESSGLMDSGFEPSPRVVHRRIMSPRLAAYYHQRNASGKYSGKSDSRIPVRKPGDKYAVDMKSVTQRIQTNMRRYYCERKIFQHLLELKRLQIRTSKANEAVLVKRAIDDYNKSNLSTVGMGPYSNPDYSFSSFEKFLYESLRKLQKSGKKHLENLPLKPIDFDYGESDLYKMSNIPDNPCLCTSKTHRCYHAVHAYTGIPCSAYIPYKWNHHTMPKPATAGGSSKSRGFLPKINSKPPTPNKAHVTLEVSHGTERQLIALPAEKLDKNKRYYVTFTVKGSEPPSDSENPQTNAAVQSG